MPPPQVSLFARARARVRTFLYFIKIRKASWGPSLRARHGQGHGQGQGQKPFFYFVDKNEAIDLDNKEDFKYLKYYVSKNLLG